MGGAFTGIADDPSAIAINPAGLTATKGVNSYLGVSALALSTEYTAPDDRSQKTESQIFFPPHLYLAAAFDTPDKVFGIGIFSPFGIGGRKWSESGLTRLYSTESLICTLMVNPTLAWQIHLKISIGMGIDYLL